MAEKKQSKLLKTLEERFKKNQKRHVDLSWQDVAQRLEAKPIKLQTLQKMEETGGEPDVIGKIENTGQFIFCDCSKESPTGRRSFCYDHAALEARKKHKPKNSAMDRAAEMGIELLTEPEYRELQQLGDFDTKTSSWLRTPDRIRKLGGAIFGDYRYETVFIYHNGAESYYAARGFRGILKV